MKEVIYKKMSRKIPECLDELNSEQYIRFLELAMMMNVGSITAHQMRCKLLSSLLGMGVNFAICDESTVNELITQLDAVNGFFDIREENSVVIYDPDLKSGRNLLPVYKAWKGPEDMLNDITFGQFVSCMNIMRDISAASQENRHRDIDSLLVSFCQMLYKHSSGAVEPTPLLLNVHSFNFFCAVWELIRTVPIPVAGQNIDFSILFQESKSSRRDDKTGWAGISFEVASSGVFGNIRQVNDALFWDVLIYLYKCRFDSIHLKQKDV